MGRPAWSARWKHGTGYKYSSLIVKRRINYSREMESWRWRKPLYSLSVKICHGMPVICQFAASGNEMGDHSSPLCFLGGLIHAQ